MEQHRTSCMTLAKHELENHTQLELLCFILTIDFSFLVKAVVMCGSVVVSVK